MRFMKLTKVKAAMGLFLAAAMMLGALTTARLTAQLPPKLGPEHEWLKESEGTWDATIKSSVGDSKGNLSCQIGLGELWLLEHFKGEFAGKPFEGRGATSYDPGKKKFVNVWIDSVTASPSVSEGTYDKATKTLTLVGDMPLPGGKSMKGAKIFVFTDANTKTYTLNGTLPGGKEFEMMKVTYTRRAK